MSFVSESFSFNGINSDDMNVMIVRTEIGSIVQKFSPDKAVYKDKPKYKDTKYFYYGSDKQILTLNFKITKMDETAFTFEDRANLMMWLCPPDGQFHDFVSSDFPELVFWVQFSKTQFDNFTTNQGILTLEAESHLPYPMSPVYYSEYDLTSNTTSEIIEVENLSNLVQYYTPLIEITMAGDTSVKIVNHTNGGQVFEFDNLNTDETVSVNNDNMQILSDTGLTRIDNFNFGFLKLVYGINRLEVFGKCTLKLKMQFPMQI